MNVDQRTIQIHLLVSLGSYIKYDQQLIFNSQNQEYNMRLAEELISQAYFLKMKKPYAECSIKVVPLRI